MELYIAEDGTLPYHRCKTAFPVQFVLQYMGQATQCRAVVNTVIYVSGEGGEFLDELRGGLLPKKDSSPRN
jgi:hypothetical protein